jgi:hypothetical protein
MLKYTRICSNILEYARIYSNISLMDGREGLSGITGERASKQPCHDFHDHMETNLDIGASKLLYRGCS